MIEFLHIYQWAILASVVFAPALALIGCHLAARDKAMQTLCIGQGASLGVLLGLGTLKILDVRESFERFGPFLSAALFSALTFYLGERVVSKRQASKNTFYTALFAFLLACGYLVCSLFPPLENHMAQVFFGDLATLSNKESFFSLALANVILVVMIVWWRQVSKQSFLEAIFGERIAIRQGKAFHRKIDFLFLVTIAFSVELLGFLFTTSMLFLPTVLVSGVRLRSVIKHYVLVGALASTATLVGFVLSLGLSRLPTVPTIAVVLVVLGAVTRLVWKLFS